MKTVSSITLACVLVISSVLFSQWQRLFEAGSFVSSLLMFMLISFDFACILYFFKRQQSAQVVKSAQLVSIISSVGIVLFSLVLAILG